MKSPLSTFCEKRHISKQLQQAFGAYLRSHYAEKFRFAPDGETVHLIVGRMGEEDLKDAWQDFVKDIAKYLPKTGV
jgi:hypothetical protein